MEDLLFGKNVPAPEAIARGQGHHQARTAMDLRKSMLTAEDGEELPPPRGPVRPDHKRNPTSPGPAMMGLKLDTNPVTRTSPNTPANKAPGSPTGATPGSPRDALSNSAHRGTTVAVNPARMLMAVQAALFQAVKSGGSVQQWNQAKADGADINFQYKVTAFLGALTWRLDYDDNEYEPPATCLAPPEGGDTLLQIALKVNNEDLAVWLLSQPELDLTLVNKVGKDAGETARQVGRQYLLSQRALLTSLHDSRKEVEMQAQQMREMQDELDRQVALLEEANERVEAFRNKHSYQGQAYNAEADKLKATVKELQDNLSREQDRLRAKTVEAETHSRQQKDQLEAAQAATAAKEKELQTVRIEKEGLAKQLDEKDKEIAGMRKALMEAQAVSCRC